ncbi:hypothetical protein N7467_005908 [Penicillium canescens]|nr:hypothetical protein N7467_005908 [Penicillium canescens]
MRFRFLYGGSEEHEEPYDVGDAWTDAETFGGDICSRGLSIAAADLWCIQRDGGARESEKNEARWRDATLTEVRSTAQCWSWRPVL